MSSGSADLPPKGGYSPIRYKRNLPARGPGGFTLLAGVVAVSVFGFYRVGLHNSERRCVVADSELKRENAWNRIHLAPLLLAEADRDTYRREQAQLAREREVMKDAGKSVYNSKRYTPSNYVVM